MKTMEKILSTYPIKSASERSGLPAHLIRVWEKRYKAIVPKRTDTNRRLYNDADILRLQLLKKATDQGHSISLIAKLPSDALMRLINSQSPADHRLQTDVQPVNDPVYLLDTALKAVIDLDEEGLEKVLTQASVHLTKMKLINEVIVPLGIKIGDYWRQGELKIINEHIATPIIRSVLWNLLRSVNVCKDAPRIVVATPVNQHHELGALAIALIAREAGWRPLYFGADLPATDIAAAVNRAKARAVALSITFNLNYLQLVKDIKDLCRYTIDDIAVFIGGQSAASIIDEVAENGVKLLKDLECLNAALDNLTTSGPTADMDKG